MRGGIWKQVWVQSIITITSTINNNIYWASIFKLNYMKVPFSWVTNSQIAAVLYGLTRYAKHCVRGWMHIISHSHPGNPVIPVLHMRKPRLRKAEWQPRVTAAGNHPSLSVPKTRVLSTTLPCLQKYYCYMTDKESKAQKQLLMKFILFSKSHKIVTIHNLFWAKFFLVCSIGMALN